MRAPPALLLRSYMFDLGLWDNSMPWRWSLPDRSRRSYNVDRQENGQIPLMVMKWQATETMARLILHNLAPNSFQQDPWRNGNWGVSPGYFRISSETISQGIHDNIFFERTDVRKVDGLRYALRQIVTSFTVDTDANKCTCKRTISDMPRRKSLRCRQGLCEGSCQFAILHVRRWVVSVYQIHTIRSWAQK